MAVNHITRQTYPRLLAGLRKFRDEVYPKRRQIYEKAAREPQQPHALLITCSDSRIDPELITQSGPGEIFVTRNVGNLVPVYGDRQSAVSAVIEYSPSTAIAPTRSKAAMVKYGIGCRRVRRRFMRADRAWR